MTISLTEFRLLQKLAGTSTTSSGGLTAANNLSDLTNVATARTNLGLGTAATTAASAYATSAQGTDERVPTSAGLTTKFGTNKASLVDGDKVLILDSAASGAPKHGLWSLVKSTLKTYFDTLYPSGSGTSSGTNTGDNAVNSSSATAAQGTTADNALPKAGGTLTGTLTATAINATSIGATTAGTGAFTTLSATGATTLSAGTVSLPSLHFGDTTTGFYRNTTNNISASVSGSRVFTLSAASFIIQDTSSLGHSGLVLKPTVAGGTETQICTGTIGNLRDLSLRALSSSTTVKLGSYTVATLPTPTIGMTCYVTNALTPTYAAAVVGGGAVTIPVFYNGTAWICA